MCKGFAPNKWGTFCRGLHDFLNAFDVSSMALASLLIIITGVMAWVELLTQGVIWTTPEWWVGPSGVLFLVVVTLLGKHTVGYGIASYWNSPKDASPKLASEKPKEGE